MVAPKLRFKEFTTQLQKRKLESVLEKHSITATISKNEMYKEIGIRSHGRGIFHKEPIAGEALGNKRVFWVKKDALVLNIVFAWEQAVAVTTDDDEGFIASHRFPMYISKDNQCDVDYIRRYLLTPKGKSLLELASPGGAGRNKTLGQKNFDELVLTLPELKEQTKIANFLSAVDERIQQVSQTHKLLTQYKKGVMQKIFSQELRFKDENGEVFGEWEEKLLGDIADIRRGGSPRPITDKKWFSDVSNVGWVRISDVSKSNKYLLSTEQYLSDAGIGKSRLVPKSHIIMSICATIGKPIYTTFDVCIHDGFVVFKDLKAEQEFLYYYLELIEKKWYQYGQPGSQVNLNIDIVCNESIVLPTLPEQTKIANFLSAIDDKINQAQSQLTALQNYKRGLLQQMFI